MAPIGEETGKTARSVVDALKTQPLLLSLVLLNVAMIVFMFYYVSNTFRARTVSVDQLFTSQKVMFEQWANVLQHQQALADKLEKCVPIDEVGKLIESVRGTSK